MPPTSTPRLRFFMPIHKLSTNGNAVSASIERR